jgi:hypothetical protein
MHTGSWSAVTSVVARASTVRAIVPPPSTVVHNTVRSPHRIHTPQIIGTSASASR